MSTEGLEQSDLRGLDADDIYDLIMAAQDDEGETVVAIADPEPDPTT